MIRSIALFSSAVFSMTVLPVISVQSAAAGSAETRFLQRAPDVVVPVQQPAPQGPELRLPGLPPIQLPPGTKVFRPDTAPVAPARPGADKNAGNGDGSKAVTRVIPNTAKSYKKPMSREDILTDLFKRLGKAKSSREAGGIIRSIEAAWLNSGSDTADLLMQRSLQALKKKNHKLAIRLLDKVVVLEPRWSEVWNQRATAKYYGEDPDGAVADIAQVLAREPRHFSALVGLGLILRRAKQEEMALKVFRRALAINPQLTNIKDIIDKLKVSVEGQGI